MNYKLNDPRRRAEGCNPARSGVLGGAGRSCRPGNGLPTRATRVGRILAGRRCASPGCRAAKLRGFNNRARGSGRQNVRRLVFLSFFVLILSFIGNGQEKKDVPANKHNARPEKPASTSLRSGDHDGRPERIQYAYEFSQPQFYIRHIVIEHDEKGQGKISFERLNEETAIVDRLEISPAALSRISAFWQGLNFLDSDTTYQSDRQFPHLGTMRITMFRGTRKRTAEFNWTNNHQASALINEYRRVADQAIFAFDVSVARQNQPLNAPKLMDLLESMLKRNWLSDPRQLVPLLKEVSNDEHLPLIARNHALRLIKKIEK